MLLLTLLSSVAAAVHAQCSCSGVVVPVGNQSHCVQVITNPNGDWTGADSSCESLGGHLSHLVENITAISSYIGKVTTQPVLTGIVAGNVETQKYTLMCQNNQYYGLFTDSSLLGQNATNSSDTCGFISSTSLLQFGSCNNSTLALCDMPMNEDDYCGIKMICDESTTTSFISKDSTTTENTHSMTSNTSTTATTKAASQNTTTKKSTTVAGGGGGGGNSGMESNITSKTSTTTTPSTTSKNANASTTTTRATTTTASCSKSGCGSYEWNIFGMCIDWRLFLILLGIFLALCCFSWLLHCCCHLCMFCRPGRSRDIEEKARPIEKRVEHNEPRKESSPKIERYSPDPVVFLPPAITQPATIPAPLPIAMPTVPSREVVEKYTREILMMYPEKPVFKDVGVNTDPWEPDLLPIREKKIKKKSKKRSRSLAPPNPFTPDETLNDEVSIDIPLTPTPDDEPFPAGDVPIVFARNTRRPPEQAAAPTIVSVTADPHQIRSPPPPKEQLVHLPAAEPDIPPKAKPISRPQRFPSPPAQRSPPKAAPEAKSQPLPIEKQPHSYSPTSPKPTLSQQAPFDGVKKNDRLFSPKPSPLAAQKAERADAGEPQPPSKQRPSRRRNDDTPVIASQFDDPPPKRRNPTPSEYSGSTRTPSTVPMNSTPLMKPPDISIRAPRGKLGGVVRAGGGGGVTPSGWKPWSKTE